MKIRIEQIEEIEDARELHRLAFEGDHWVGDDHTFWAAYDEGGAVVGLCSAVYRPDKGYVYLSRCAVVKRAQGHGIQRRLIRKRIKWAISCGAKECVTYTLLHNYDSMMNLVKCGFRFYRPPKAEQWAGRHVHYLRIDTGIK